VTPTPKVRPAWLTALLWVALVVMCVGIWIVVTNPGHVLP
jgi:hypothetical protein